MKEEKVFLVLAILTVGVSLLAAGFLYFSISSLFNHITAFVTTGEVNLTVETLAQVNFTTDQVNFLSGRVFSDRSNASLNTTNPGNTRNVSGGNWTKDTGLIIENIGNVNLTLNLCKPRLVNDKFPNSPSIPSILYSPIKFHRVG